MKKISLQFCGLCNKFPCQWVVQKITWNPNIVEHLTKLAKQYHEQKNGKTHY